MRIRRKIEASYLFIKSQGKATGIVLKLNHLRANFVCFPGTLMPTNNSCPSISIMFLISFSQNVFYDQVTWSELSFNVL